MGTVVIQNRDFREPISGGNCDGDGDGWVNPPRMQDNKHEVALSESFYTTMCIVVTELTMPPPQSPSDDQALPSSLQSAAR